MPVSKNKVVKKVSLAPKQSKPKMKSKRPLVVAQGYLCFWVNNGPILKNLVDLKNALTHINDAQYRHHAGKSRNDFAVWTRLVLKDGECADLLEKAINKEDALSIVTKALKNYSL